MLLLHAQCEAILTSLVDGAMSCTLYGMTAYKLHMHCTIVVVVLLPAGTVLTQCSNIDIYRNILGLAQMSVVQACQGVCRISQS